MNSPVNPQVEHVLLVVIIQLVLIIAAARLFGVIFRHLGQPQVCGEIAAGIILGPSLFGRFFPSLFLQVFQPSVALVFSILSQIGLILLMFLIGLQFDFSHLRTHGHVALSISLAGIILPFGLGLALARVVYPYVGQNINKLGFALFVATALSITALPVLGRMLIEFNIGRTRLGSLTITAAAVDDATGWIILALVSAIVRARFNPLTTVTMVGQTLAYALFMIFVARPWLRRWTTRAMHAGGGEISLSALAFLLILVFSSAGVTNIIGLFSIFGAFIVGAVLYDQQEFREAVMRRLRDFATVFFLPIFFTYTGLRTDIGAMHGALMWVLCGLVLLVAIAGKVGGCTTAALLNGLPWKESLAVGVLMNTRGLMELIAVNLGHDLGVIPKSLFFMLVLMAVMTTYMTAPLLRRLMRKTELEPFFQVSGLVQQAQTGQHSHSQPASRQPETWDGRLGDEN
jgi:Kef-type K+ transport system membrane component KefB